MMAVMAACSRELAPPDPRVAPALRFEPAVEADAVTPVVRLSVAAWEDPATLRLFRDELSEYHLGRIRADELPGTLLEREVPTIAFATSGHSTSAPLEVLAPGIYSLASAEHGLIGSFAVDGSVPPPLLTRLWPPPGAAGNVGIYCGERAPAEPLDVVLEPAGVAGRLTPGASLDALFAERCLRLELAEALPPGAVALPPPLTWDVLLDPSPWFGSEPGTAIVPDCVEAEVELGAACGDVGDDRVSLRANQPLLILFREPSPALVVLDAAGRSNVQSGLPPASELWLAGETLDSAGRVTAFRELITTKAAVARVVINEQLANAAGSEPAQEWIELVNDGTAAVDLAGYRLEDGGGSVTLPSHVLAPDEFAVLVSADYVPDPALDVVPAAPEVLLVLPSLGKNGLSNSGELLRLFDAAGSLVSSFPAVKSSAAGVSVARRTPDSADGDVAAFAAHASPGASPGAPNTLAD
ncbi:MAG TPA: lamin tail domain-containing protein [Polyangiaceae bacterium]|nr:lamin tail domain-containing protein [Polyangiaceae bacterium]